MGYLKNQIKPERAVNYNESQFDELFNKFDEDKNGFIDKTEMAVFIKKIFSTKGWIKNQKEAKKSVSNQIKLA